MSIDSPKTSGFNRKGRLGEIEGDDERSRGYSEVSHNDQRENNWEMRNAHRRGMGMQIPRPLPLSIPVTSLGSCQHFG